MVSIEHCLQSMLECTKHIGIDYCLKQIVLRMFCKVCLEGGGNSDWRKVQSLGTRLKMDRANILF